MPSTPLASRHIVHIIDELPPDGAERLVVDLLQHRNGAIRYSVICLITGGMLVDELTRMRVPVIILGQSSKFDITLLFRLRRWLITEKVEIVHTHLFTADFWGRLAAKLAGIKYIYSTSHSTSTWKSPLHRALDRYISRVATTCVIACSEEVSHVLVNRDKIPPNKVTVIDNGIDLGRFSETDRLDLSNEFPQIKNKTVLAVIGRYHPAKGHQELLPVLNQLKLSGRDFCCLFIGDGELRGILESQISQLGLTEHVILTGLRKDVPALLKYIDIVVMPSRWEGLPMALLESMAASKPVLATRVGGIPNVVTDNQTGLLVDPNDPNEMLEKMIRLIDNPELRQQLGAAAKTLIYKKYSVEATARAYENLYLHYLAKST